MVKRNRNYILTIKPRENDPLLIKIKLPFTIDIDIDRNNLSAASTAIVRIYNLSKDIRDQIRKDVTNLNDVKRVVLQAGYGEDLSVIFNGNIMEAFSVREGVNFITQFTAFDGGFAFTEAKTAQQFTGPSTPTSTDGTPVKSIYTNLAVSLSQFGISLGAIGNYVGTISRSNAYVGGTMDILREITGGGVFIDNGKVHILKDNEYIEGTALLINANSGLLGTPLRENFYINFEMIFEPKLAVGRLVKLQSRTDRNFNGLYKVVSVKHVGMISEAVAGSVITSVSLFNSKPFVAVPSATG